MCAYTLSTYMQINMGGCYRPNEMNEDETLILKNITIKRISSIFGNEVTGVII